jgi:hypothetical protein
MPQCELTLKDYAHIMLLRILMVTADAERMKKPKLPKKRLLKQSHPKKGR